MKNILVTIYESTAEYFGASTYLVAAIFVGILLMLTDRKKYAKLIIPSLIILVTILNPVSYKLILHKTRFWRLFWMIPYVYIILLGFIELIKRYDSVWKKLAITFSCLIIIMISGNNIYAGHASIEDMYRLPEGVTRVAEKMLEEEAHPRCIVGGDLKTSIRLYSGDIEPMYGRNVENYINKASEYDKKIDKEMESEHPDYKYILSYARRLKYSFVVNTADKPIDRELQDRYGYKLLDESKDYNIYYNSELDYNNDSDYEWKSNGTGWYCVTASGERIKGRTEEIDGVWYYFNLEGYLIESVESEDAEKLSSDDLIITQYGSDSYDQPSMCYTIDDQRGHLYIIDGGNSDEYKRIYDVIKMYDRHVTAWILTHPHPDHIGAFNYIYKNFVKDAAEGKNDYHQVVIDDIYAVDLDSEYYHQVAREWDYIESYDKFNELMDGADNLTYVKRGETYALGDNTFKVYNTFTDESYDIKTGSLPNAAGMVFELFGKNSSMLFLSDLEQENADLVMKLFGDELEADYVQAAHHGQNLETDIYDLIGADTVFVDAPECLRLEDQSTHTSYEHLLYFREKMNIKTYDTAPNTVVLK